MQPKDEHFHVAIKDKQYNKCQSDQFNCWRTKPKNTQQAFYTVLDKREYTIILYCMYNAKCTCMAMDTVENQIAWSWQDP